MRQEDVFIMGLERGRGVAHLIRGATVRRGLVVGAVTLTAALGGVSVSGATAQASTGDGPQRHCVADADSARAEQCFGSFRAAIAYATDGRVTSAPESPEVAMKDRGFTAELNQATRQAASNYIVGIMYQHINYGGASWTWTGTGGCTDSIADVDFHVAAMPGGWDNVASSMKGYSNCGMKMFEHANFAGVSSDGFYIEQGFLGVLNDHASSIQFS